MKAIGWVYDGVLVLMSAAVGFYAGRAGLGMVELIGMGAWASVIILTVFAILLFLVVVVIDQDVARFSGIKPAPAGTRQTNKHVRRRKRNGWIGFFFGVAVAIIASMFIPLDQTIGFF